MSVDYSQAIANRNEVSTEKMLAEKLWLMEVKQAEMIEATTQKAKRDAIVEYERERGMHIEGRAVQDNPANEGPRSTYRPSHPV